MKEKGITLIEIAVVVFIIALLLMILVADFPKIQRQFALSRATYKFAQDLRRAEDLALSGSEIKESDGTIVNIKGYGVYLNLDNSQKEYIIYADIDGSQTYNAVEKIDCQNYDSRYNSSDCVIETVDLAKDAPGVQIDRLYPEQSSRSESINFSPPNPTIAISGLVSGNRTGVILKTQDGERAVYVYTSGLIEAK